MSTFAKILAVAVACSAVVSVEATGRYKKIKNTSQDGHNDDRVFFQDGQQWDTNQGLPGDANAATQCSQLCTDITWCVSFDIQRARGECNLSRTRIGDPDGGIAKVDPNADYYEWVDQA